MKIEIIGKPIDKIFDILKTSNEVINLKCYCGKINVLLGNDTSAEAIKMLKNNIIMNLSGTVKNYIMKVIN